MEGSLVAYKVFTNGSTLQASELNENLMQQATAVFSNAAARTAAITSPVEGQLTYLEDTNQYASWNGSAWVSPFGATLVASTDFTAASTVSVNNVFTTSYDFYQINLSFTKLVAQQRILFQLRNAGTDISSDYRYQVVRATGTSVDTFSQASSGTDRVPINDSSAIGSNGSWTWNVYNPALALNTTFNSSAYAFDGTNSNIGLINGEQNQALARDGFRFYTTSGTFTGKIKVYGMRNLV
jgi:hypothetical protein